MKLKSKITSSCQILAGIIIFLLLHIEAFDAYEALVELKWIEDTLCTKKGLCTNVEFPNEFADKLKKCPIYEEFNYSPANIASIDIELFVIIVILEYTLCST